MCTEACDYLNGFHYHHYTKPKCDGCTTSCDLEIYLRCDITMAMGAAMTLLEKVHDIKTNQNVSLEIKFRLGETEGHYTSAITGDHVAHI